MVAKELLEKFYGLSANNANLRCKSAFEIVGSDKTVEDSEYALKRLTKGLVSSREASRQGFATTISGFIMNDDTTNDESILKVLKQIKSGTQLKSNMKKVEEKEAILGRLLGIGSVIQAYIAMELSFSKVLIQYITKEIVALLGTRVWVEAPAYFLLNDLLEAVENKEDEDIIAVSINKHLEKINEEENPGLSISQYALGLRTYPRKGSKLKLHKEVESLFNSSNEDEISDFRVKIDKCSNNVLLESLSNALGCFIAQKVTLSASNSSIVKMKKSWCALFEMEDAMLSKPMVFLLLHSVGNLLKHLSKIKDVKSTKSFSTIVEVFISGPFADVVFSSTNQYRKLMNQMADFSSFFTENLMLLRDSGNWSGLALKIISKMIISSDYRFSGNAGGRFAGNSVREYVASTNEASDLLDELFARKKDISSAHIVNICVFSAELLSVVSPKLIAGLEKDILNFLIAVILCNMEKQEFELKLYSTISSKPTIDLSEEQKIIMQKALFLALSTIFNFHLIALQKSLEDEDATTPDVFKFPDVFGDLSTISSFLDHAQDQVSESYESLLTETSAIETKVMKARNLKDPIFEILDIFIFGLKSYLFPLILVENAGFDIPGILEVFQDTMKVKQELSVSLAKKKKSSVTQEILILADSLIATLAQNPEMRKMVYFSFLSFVSSQSDGVEDNLCSIAGLVLKNLMEEHPVDDDEEEMEVEEEENEGQNDDKPNDSESDENESVGEDIQEIAEKMAETLEKDEEAEEQGDDVDKNEYDEKLTAFVVELMKSRKSKKSAAKQLEIQANSFRTRNCNLLDYIISPKAKNSAKDWKKLERKELISFLPILLLKTMNSCFNSKRQFQSDSSRVLHNKISSLLEEVLGSKLDFSLVGKNSNKESSFVELLKDENSDEELKFAFNSEADAANKLVSFVGRIVGNSKSNSISSHCADVVAFYFKLLGEKEKKIVMAGSFQKFSASLLTQPASIKPFFQQLLRKAPFAFALLLNRLLTCIKESFELDTEISSVKTIALFMSSADLILAASKQLEDDDLPTMGKLIFDIINVLLAKCQLLTNELPLAGTKTGAIALNEAKLRTVLQSGMKILAILKKKSLAADISLDATVLKSLVDAVKTNALQSPQIINIIKTLVENDEVSAKEFQDVMDLRKKNKMERKQEKKRRMETYKAHNTSKKMKK